MFWDESGTGSNMTCGTNAICEGSMADSWTFMVQTTKNCLIRGTEKFTLRLRDFAILCDLSRDFITVILLLLSIKTSIRYQVSLSCCKVGIKWVLNFYEFLLLIRIQRQVVLIWQRKLATASNRFQTVLGKQFQKYICLFYFV